jgi:hypothetical protein
MSKEQNNYLLSHKCLMFSGSEDNTVEEDKINLLTCKITSTGIFHGL